MWDITIHPPFRAQRPRWHSFLPPIDVGSPHKSTPLWSPRPYWHTLVSTPLRGTARRLAHHLMSGSDTICNDRGLPLANIGLFGLASPQGFKTCLLGEGFHTRFVLLPNQCGTSQYFSFEELIEFCKTLNKMKFLSLYRNIVNRFNFLKNKNKTFNIVARTLPL